MHILKYNYARSLVLYIYINFIFSSTFASLMTSFHPTYIVAYIFYLSIYYASALTARRVDLLTAVGSSQALACHEQYRWLDKEESAFLS